MNKDGSNPVRDEAVVRAHAWAVRLWNERKISADFTSEDEAELVEMLLGFLAVAPYPEPTEGADFAALKNENYYLQVDNAKLRFYIEELEVASRTIDMHLAQQAAKQKYEAAFGPDADTFKWIFDGPREIVDLRRQLETMKQENCDLLIGHAELTRRLALAQSIIASLGNPHVQEYPLSQETVIPPDVSGSGRGRP